MASHFYHESDHLVLDCLDSLSLTSPDLLFDKSKKSVWLRNHDSSANVAILSGGGAGHEPAFAGYVGEGLLTGAVSGNIFASPSVSQITSVISRVAGPAGVLLVIMNYTGDVFHFHLAAEKARAATGSPVEVLVIGDDVSVGRTKSGKVGRRGLAGTVLVDKILGAYSHQPSVGLDELVRMGKSVSENLVTVGTSLGHVHIPGRPKPDQQSSFCELGMGIHNEPGCRVLDPQPALPELIDLMLDQLLNKDDTDRGYVDFSDAKDIVVMINNLGGTSPLEFGGITTNVLNALTRRRISPSRVLTGPYMTSLDGLGFSITLLKATPEMLSYIDAPTTAAGWIPARQFAGTSNIVVDKESEAPDPKSALSSGVELDLETFKKILSQACHNLISAENIITQHDSVVGDGDCGVTLARGANAVLDFLNSPQLTIDAVASLLNLTAVIEDGMDGTSGALYSIFIAALASEVRQQPPGPLSEASWIAAGQGALRKLQQATPARQGDRTLMDALEPFIDALVRGAGLAEAVQDASRGVAATKGMRGAFGRAVYVEERNWSEVPDPGAEGLLCILTAFQDHK